jgi:Raf kinase inhibitor-like YbhB/YbcL family protein
MRSGNVKPTRRKLEWVFATLGATACGTGTIKPLPPPGVTVASITVTSKSFAPNGAIPIDYTCDGKNASPQLTWSSPPEGTRALTLMLEDPDASGGTFTHWIVYGLPPETRSIGEAVDPVTLGAKVGANDFPDVRYSGPCPPRAELHRYYFRIIAVDAPLKLNEGARRAVVDAAMNGHVLGEGALMGNFSH